MKILRSVLLIAIACLIFTFDSLTYGVSQSESVIISNPSFNQVTIDGMWTTQDEWIDAAELSSKEAVLSVKDNGEYVYVLLDFLADETLENGDLAGMNIDVSNDKAAKPQLDDFSIGLVHGSRPKPTLMYFQGNSTEWNLIYTEGLAENHLGIIAASTNVNANNPYSNSSHLIYEFAIPRKTLGNASEIGFAAFVEDKEVKFNIPHNADPYPASWTTLRFATEAEEIVTQTDSSTILAPTEQIPAPSEMVTPPQSVHPPQSNIGAQEIAILAMIFTILIIGTFLIRRRKIQKRKGKIKHPKPRKK